MKFKEIIRYSLVIMALGLGAFFTLSRCSKTVKKSISDLIKDLSDEEYALSVRAANTISLLDDVTQDPNLPSYVRTQLWQAVSKLESIRE